MTEKKKKKSKYTFIIGVVIGVLLGKLLFDVLWPMIFG